MLDQANCDNQLIEISFTIFSTFVCPTEIIAFSDRIKDFEALNTSVVGVSVDSHFSHLAWINTPRKVISAAKQYRTITN